MEHLLEIKEATFSHIPTIANLMKVYYQEDGYDFSDKNTLSNLQDFINDPNLGQIFVVLAEGNICGYIIVTNGYSFEYGGKDAFVDELFVLSQYRGKGFGKQLLYKAIDFCFSKNIKALHLEVEHYKDSVHQLYLTAGFVQHSRSLMTLFPTK